MRKKVYIMKKGKKKYLTENDLTSLYFALLNQVSLEWKKQTDQTIELLREELKNLQRRYHNSTAKLEKERDKYNEIVHHFNIERQQLNSLTLTLQEKLNELETKLKEEKAKE